MFWHFRSLHKKMLLQLGKKGELIKSILTSKKDWFWYCDVSVYKNIRIRASTRIPDTQRIQKFPLWRAYTEISGYTEHIRRTRVDARCIRIKKFADTKISGYVWTGPQRTFWWQSGHFTMVLLILDVAIVVLLAGFLRPFSVLLPRFSSFSEKPVSLLRISNIQIVYVM